MSHRPIPDPFYTRCNKICAVSRPNRYPHVRLLETIFQSYVYFSFRRAPRFCSCRSLLSQPVTQLAEEGCNARGELQELAPLSARKAGAPPQRSPSHRDCLRFHLRLRHCAAPALRQGRSDRIDPSVWYQQHSQCSSDQQCHRE